MLQAPRSFPKLNRRCPEVAEATQDLRLLAECNHDHEWDSQVRYLSLEVRPLAFGHHKLESFTLMAHPATSHCSL